MTTPASPSPPPARTSIVTASDGVALAVYEYGDTERPTLVAVHGFPDDHQVWDGVTALLAEDFHVVTYDVRGAGASAAPASRSGYRMPQLVADLRAVIEATSPTRSVHLLAHDWGSIQAWDGVLDPATRDKIASFTSISGPSLAMAGQWLKDRTHLRATLTQARASSYIVGFRLPAVPDLLIRSGILARLVAASQRGGPAARPQHRRIRERDAINGLELYRANMLTRHPTARLGRAQMPVQVLAPRHDAHVTVDLQCGAPTAYVDDLRTEVIEGNHWVIEQDPALIARHVRQFISEVAWPDPSQPGQP